MGGVVGGGGEGLCLTLYCHHQNDSALRSAAMRDVLIHVLFIVMGRVTRQCFIQCDGPSHKTVFY